MKDGLPKPISQNISLQEAITVGVYTLSSYSGTLPVLNNLEDVLVWRWTENGEYSAGSVYKMLIEAGRIKCKFFSNWRAAAPSKVQVFSQLLLKGKLPTRDMLQRRGINCEIDCVMCQASVPETAHHIFFECQNAKDVWTMFAIFLKIDDTVSATWEASRKFYCTSTDNQVMHIWVSSFMAVLGSIWRQRNEVIFRDKKVPPWIVANRAAEDARMWQKFCRPRAVLGLGIVRGASLENT